MNTATILIIDDDATFAGVLVRALARRGITAFHAASIDAAKPHLAAQPERILLDLNLGGDSGLQFLPEIVGLCPNAAVVLLTGYASIATAVEAIKLGAHHYLAKPASVDEILAAFEHKVPDPGLPLPSQPLSVRRMTWEHVQRVLAEHGGNISATARALNMHRRTLQRMLAKHPVKQ